MQDIPSLEVQYIVVAGGGGGGGVHLNGNAAVAK